MKDQLKRYWIPLTIALIGLLLDASGHLSMYGWSFLIVLVWFFLVNANEEQATPDNDWVTRHALHVAFGELYGVLEAKNKGFSSNHLEIATSLQAHTDALTYIVNYINTPTPAQVSSQRTA